MIVAWTLKERGRLEYLGVGWRIILKRYREEIRWEGVEWIDLTQDRDNFSGCCGRGNEPSGFVDVRVFID